ncbi:hypothetical protein MSAS_23680 [Mycobacterium saskatchewanense]|uniref:Uncharacterized protein n=2 Tax=Mycobacterium saskatchewanense TaxID=220927 RepID=A0AAJ3NPA0_9MYCO|nr:hypothetical protein AWC23_17210 [Mycobacterium saskatchewanense]BBX63194.1 hypothetical protein MSAS_23680 [Mycobacterium saskatchewanense]
MTDASSDAKPEYTDAQKEQLRKAYQSLTAGMQAVDLSKLMPSIAGIQRDAMPNLDAIAKSLASTQNFGVDLAKSLQANIPKFKLELPPLQLDYTRLLGPVLNFENLGLKNLIDASSLKVFDKIYADQRTQFEGIFEKFRKYIEGMLPPNWRGVRGLNQLETLLLDEGLALAWVPPADILDALLAASSKQARRRILGRRWKRVVAACRESIESASEADVAQYRGFALNVIKMLEDGHPEGAQALAANLLDTMLRETLDGPSRREVTDQRNRLSIDDLPMRAAMVFGGIWGSHTEFWQSRGDSIPREFTRHGSAHAVSRMQYSRINAVIALMHVTAYIMLLDSGDLS